MATRSILTIILLWAAGLTAAAQFAKIAVPFPEVAALFPGTEARIGLLLSSISLVGAVFGVFAGAVVSRLGATRALLVGLLAGGLLSLAQAAPMAFGWMLASRILEGASHLFVIVSAPILVSRFASSAMRGAAMAFWSTFFTVAFALVAWTGLPLAEARGARSLFLVHGISMVTICVALAAVLLRHNDRGRARLEQRASAPLSVSQARSRAWLTARVLAPGIGWFFYTFTFVALVAILPAILPPAARLGATITLPLLGVIVSLTLGPILLRVLSGLAVAGLGFVICIAAIAAIGAGIDAGFSIFVIFAAFGLIQCGSFAAVPELNSGAREQALSHGVIAQAGNLGNLIGTPVLLYAADRVDGEGVFIVVAVLYAFAILASWSLQRRARSP